MTERPYSFLRYPLAASILGVVGLFFLFCPSPVSAATKYWIGSSGGNVSSNSNWSTSSGGANNTTVPTSSDLAVFSSDNTNSANVDASFVGSLGGIQIDSGYSGTITLQRSLTVGASHYSQAGGTLALGAQTLTIGANSTATNFTITGGTFSADTGTLAMTATGNRSVDVATSVTLYNYTVALSTVTIASGDTLVVTNSLTLTSGTLNGPGFVEMQGATTTVGATGTGGTLQIKYLVAGDQAISSSGGAVPGILINKPSDSVIQSGNLQISTGDFTLQSGTYTTGSSTLTLAGADFTMTGGTFTPSTGTVAFTGATATFDVATSLTLNNVTFGKSNAAAPQTIATGDTMIVTGTLTFNGNGPVNGPGVIEMRGSNTVISSTGATGTAVVQYLVAGDQTITGSGGSMPGMLINKPSGTIAQSGSYSVSTADFTLQSGTYDVGSGTLTLNGADFTISGGTFTGSAGTVAFTGASATFNVDTSLTLNNVTFEKSNAAAPQTIATGDTMIVTGTLTVNGNGPVNGPGVIEMRGSNTVVNSAGATGTAVVQYLVAGDQTITGSGGSMPGMLINKPSGTITQSGSYSVSTADFTLQSGTYDVGSGTLTLAGADFTMTGGTFTPSTGTVAFTGATATFDVATSLTLNNVTFGKSSAAAPQTIASGDTMIVTGTLTFNGNGPVNGPGVIEMRGSNTVISSTGATGTAVVQYLVAGDQTITGSGGSMPGMLINKPSGSVTQSGDIIVNTADFTLQSGTYTTGSNTLTLAGADFTMTGGTFTPSTGTVAFTGATATFDVATSLTLNNVTFGKLNAAHPQTIATGDTMIVTGTLTFSGSGPVNGPGVIEMRGTTTTVAGLAGGTVPLTFSGTAEQTYQLTSGDEPDGDVTINKASGAFTLLSSFDLDDPGQALTITAGTLKLNGRNVTVTDALTVGASGVLERFGDETITRGSLSLASGSTVRYTGDGDAAVDGYVLTTFSTTYHHLVVNSTDGATDTFAISASPLTINGSLTITAGTVTGGTATINVAGNWANSGTFTANTSTVSLTGTSQQISGTTTFYNLSKTVSSADTLTFAAGATQTVTNTWTAQGATGQLLSLRSSSSPTQWLIDPQTTRTIAYLDVADSNNTNGTTISVDGFHITNSENNTGWNFATSISIAGQNPQTTAGGKSITINGTGFSATPTITVGGTSATSVVYVNATTVTAVAPAKAAGSYDVIVTNPDNSTGTCSDCMTYIAPPTVDSIDEQYTSSAGGATRVIAGAGMKVGTTGLVIDPSGTADAATTTGTATSITFTTPTHTAGDVVVRVYGTSGTNANGIYTDTSSGFLAYEDAPTFTNIDQPYLPTVSPGTRTLTGTNLKVGSSGILIDGAATTTAGTASSVTFTPPNHSAGSVTVRIYSTHGTDTNGLYADEAAALTYEAKPTITTVVPDSGLTTAGGTSVAVTGTNLKVGSSGGTIDPAGTADAVTTAGTSTSITFTTPAHTAGSVALRVYSPHGTSNNELYADYSSLTFSAALTVTGVTGQNPQTTAGGKSITITGTNFVTTPTITVGGTSATSVAYVSATTLTAVAPAKTAGTYDVVVTNPDTQSATCVDCMEYIAPPTVTSIDEQYTSSSGGATRTVTGSAMKVGANGIVIDPAGVATAVTTTGTSTTTNFTTPAHSAGDVTVRVYGTVGTNNNGIYLDVTNSFTYEDSPIVTGYTPSGGLLVSGGEIATIVGSNLKVGASGAIMDPLGLNTALVTAGTSTAATFTSIAHAAGSITFRFFSTNGTATNGLYTDTSLLYVEPAPASSSSATNGGGALLHFFPQALPNVFGQRPSLDFVINDGSTKTTNPLLQLFFNADPALTRWYAASLDPALKDAGLVNYSLTAALRLPDSAGTYTVYVRYYSITGNSSAVLAHSISYDPAQTTSIIPAQCLAHSFARDLKPGVLHADVKALQSLLNSQGFTVAQTGAGSKGKETNFFGAATKAALMAWQKAAGLKTDGLFTGQTKNTLQAKVTVVPCSAIVKFPRDLKPGVVHPDVQALQIFLNNHGFNLAQTGAGSKGRETNFFGAATMTALKDFQKTAGLTADGIFAGKTRERVNQTP